ncbi:MAG: fused MFS/spermidine synthase [Rubripirellula sp.]
MANDRESRSGTFLLVAVCFLLSGFAGLLYETVWLRQFAIVLGTSEQALAVILASYMGGLSIGSWVAGKRVDSLRRPVWAYGLLEAGIAICALAMPLGLYFVEQLQVALFGGSPTPPAAGSLSQTLFGLGSCFALILLPTAMMGATLPLLAKHVVHRNRQVGPRIGLLYGINTLGAAAGTLAAAFVFMPRLGLRQTTWVGAAVNLLIFVSVFLVMRNVRVRSSVASVDDASAVQEDAVDALDGETQNLELGELSSKTSSVSGDVGGDEDSIRYRFVLWFAAFAGAVAFCYEIIFTRMLSHILGGSIYAFATMLAGFLLGIAIGGMVASRLAVRRDRSVIAFVYAQCLAGASALIGYRLIDEVAGWSLANWGGTSAVFSQVSISILILLPTATFIGATIPLATRIFARDQFEAARGSAKVYFWNTVGGIAGALLTGVFILPRLDYHGSTIFAILVNACIALALVGFMNIRKVHYLAALALLILLLCFAPAMPEKVMRISALNGTPTEGDLIFSSVGRSGTVALFDQQGDTRFMTNGLPEAMVGQNGSQDPSASSGAWLAALPPLLRADCDSMLIIGLGGGVAAAHVPPSIDEIDVFELEPAVVEANEFVRKRRNRDPLADDRVSIVLNDGRNGLALTSKLYDVIVSQPSHPWTTGASHLYTREFAETVRERLEPGGIFLQWMSTDFVNPELFRSLSATLLDVFPHVRVYEPHPGNALFVASDDPILPEAAATDLEIDQRDLQFYREFGIQTPTHLLATLRAGETELRELSKDAPLITDEFNLLAMKAPSLLANRDAEEMESFLAEHSIYKRSRDQILRNCPSADFLVFSMRMLYRDWGFDAEDAKRLIPDSADRILFEALTAKKEGETERWGQLLKQLAAEHPEDPRPAYLLLSHLRLGTYRDLQQAEAKELEGHLDSRYSDLLRVVDAVTRNDLTTLQQQDSLLASFGIDEIGFELAVRMRVLWRMADAGPNQQSSNLQALELITDAVPLLGTDALITFRVAAAIGADRPSVALASTVGYAKFAVDRIKKQNVTQASKLGSIRSNLIKCRTMIGDRASMQSIPNERYQSAIEYVDRVIAGDI